MRRLRAPLIAFLILAMLAPRSPAQEPERPRLVVLLVFDQMRGDYPARWHEHFGPGGFKRLQEEGTWFKNCHYPYANTITAPGHTSLVTGCSPYKHGIVGNGWYDRSLRQILSCIENEKYRQLPAPAVIPKGEKLGVTPEHRLQKSVGDMLHDATKGKGKVVSLSIKDRSAALMAALLGHLVYWFSELTGGFCTSSFYRGEPHEWVERFNEEKLADRYFGKNWERFRPGLDYNKIAGPDDQIGEEHRTRELGKTFPHPLTGGLKSPGPKFYDALTMSPMGNDLLLDFAKRAIAEEDLGQDDVPDLLLLGFSTNDTVGHLYGPDSQEVLDVTLRTDALIEDLLKHLDAKVGKGKYAVLLSADHGICPLPEVAAAKGKDAGRIVPSYLRKGAESFLQATFGASERPYVEEFASPWFYLDRKTLAALKITPEDAEKRLADFLMKHPAAPFEAVYTRSELIKGMPKDKLGASVWRSFHPERCGDVILVTRPYHFVSSYPAGTTHGSPHAYDTHVPLYVMGPGVRAGISEEPVTPLAAAPIMARLLGVDPPPGAEVGVPEHLKARAKGD